MVDKNDAPDVQGAKKNKGPMIAVIAVVVLVALGGVFALTGKGSTQNSEKMNEIAPASADASKAADNKVIEEGNPVVAVINGEEIHRSDVFNFIVTLPEQVRQMPLQTLFPLALEQVINNHVVTSKADTANLDNDPEVSTLASQAKEQIVRNVYVDRQIDEQITQKRLLKAYEDLLNQIGDVQETKARHILVEDETKAKELITKLDGGADFETLAKENSTGPTSENGGELGWFAKAEMVPEFAEAAFALEPGTYTKEPVKTQFGWHVIKAEERRTRPEPEFEVVKPQLEAKLRQEVLAELIAGWQKEAKIEKFDINGEVVKN